MQMTMQVTNVSAFSGWLPERYEARSSTLRDRSEAVLDPMVIRP